MSVAATRVVYFFLYLVLEGESRSIIENYSKLELTRIHRKVFDYFLWPLNDHSLLLHHLRTMSINTMSRGHIYWIG